MTLTQSLIEHVEACFTGIWIESHEHDDALLEIAQVCRDQQWQLALWDADAGLQSPGQAAETTSEAGNQDPLAAIKSIDSFANPDSSTLLVLRNLHRFLSSTEVIQAVAGQITRGKQNRTFVVVLSPVAQIPVELDKQFVILEHPLPDRQQLSEIAQGVATEEGELPEDDALEAVIDAASGLTRAQAEGAFSLSLVRHQHLAAEALWDIKAQELKKSGLLTLHQGRESFADLGGLDALKEFCTRSLRRTTDCLQHCRAKGVLLLSPPGCGKSQFAKALGNEVGRPTLTLDIGALMGSLVGQTEERTRQALQIADAMAPCILFCDEIEKALSGAASSGQTDAGVSARLFGTLLTYLSDHQSDVYFVGTCNDISKLPPEFSRAERFDGIFFLDLPGEEQRQQIWDIYLALYGLDPEEPRPRDKDFTGAEIQACCRLAALLEMPLAIAAANVVPVAYTAAESLDKLRNWASGRCLSADRVGLYRYQSVPKVNGLNITPSQN